MREEKIRRVQESLLLVWQRAEDSKPHVKGGEKDNRSQTSLKPLGRWGNDLLEDEKRQRGESEDKPKVEVQRQVLEVECPRLSPV